MKATAKTDVLLKALDLKLMAVLKNDLKKFKAAAHYKKAA